MSSRVYKTKPILPAFDRHLQNEPNLSGDVVDNLVKSNLFDAGAAVQIGLDLQPGSAAEPETIDLQILHDPLHVIAGLGERDQFDPVDRIDLGVAGIAITVD